jgi:hypothetical protein
LLKLALSPKLLTALIQLRIDACNLLRYMSTPEWKLIQKNAYEILEKILSVAPLVIQCVEIRFSLW